MKVIEPGDLVEVLLLNDNRINAIIVSLPSQDFQYFSMQEIRYSGENTWNKVEGNYSYINVFQRIKKLNGVIKK